MTHEEKTAADEEMVTQDSVSVSSAKPELNENLSWALRYLSIGWSVFPVGIDDKGNWKKSLIKWRSLETQLPSSEQVKEWWSRWPEARVGVVTGALSGIVVVDVDPRHGGSVDGLDVPATLISKTGGGGWHYIYEHPGNGLHIKTIANWPREGIDIRGDGGYFVVPPSIHASGEAYEWALDFESDHISPCPNWLTEKAQSETRVPISELLGGVPMGQRNDAATRVVGFIFSKLKTEEFDTKGWELLSDWNKKNPSPLEENELRSVFESIKGRELSVRAGQATAVKGKKSSKKEEGESFIELFMNVYDISFFRDAKKDGFVRITNDGANKLISSTSTELSDLYRALSFGVTGKPVSENKVREAMALLSANARLGGELVSPSLRVIKEKDTHYYDLANDAAECIKIDATGWHIINNPGIPFITNRLTAEQIRPTEGGDINDLFRFINIKNEDDRLLLIAALTACFIPEIAHPVLIIHGPKGSAKTSTMRLIKTLVDPSEVTSVHLTKDLRDLAVNFNSSWLVPFDNVTFISPDVSDALSKVVTGDSFSVRKLYGDTELSVMTFRRCLIINGINNPVRKPDLLDRSVLIEIERIEDSARRSETELKKEQVDSLPKILGAIFDIISHALAALPSVPRENLARLADFDLWGRAVSIALTSTSEPFMTAYAKNVNRQSDEAIEQSQFAQALLEYLEKNVPGRVELSPTELLKAISEGVEDKISQGKDFPQSPAKLSQRLNELSPDLLNLGFRLTRRSTGRKRLITIERVATTNSSPIAISIPTVPVENNLGNGILFPEPSMSTLPMTLTQVKKEEWDTDLLPDEKNSPDNENDIVDDDADAPDDSNDQF